MMSLQQANDSDRSVRSPWIVISAGEVLVVHFVAVMISSAFNLRLDDNPRVDELCGWAPIIIRPWAYWTLASIILAPITCLFPLLAWSLLPKSWRERIPIHVLSRGSPPFVGAILGLAITACFFAGFFLLAELED